MERPSYKWVLSKKYYYMRQNVLTSVTSVCTSVITVTRLVRVTVCVVAAPLDLVVNDGVDVVIAKLAALAL